MDHCRRYYRFTLSGRIFAAVALFVFIAAVNSQTNLLFFAFGIMLGMLVLTGGLAVLVHLPFILLDALRRLARGSADPPSLMLMPAALQTLVETLSRLCDPLGWLMMRGIEVTRHLEDHAVAGQITLMQYEIHNHKARWPVFALQVTEAGYRGELATVPHACCLHLAPGGTATTTTQIAPRFRGLLELQDLEYTCAFPFGFVERAFRAASPMRLVVYPRVGLLNRDVILRCREYLLSGAMTADLRGGQDEFYGLREYRPGDNVKTIHWRRTAKTGELVVREMTNNAPPQMVVVLNLRPWRDMPRRNKAELDEATARVEHAVELAASLVCYGFLENFAVGLYVVGGEHPELAQPRSGRDNRGRLLETLALVQAEQVAHGPAVTPGVRGKTRVEWVVVTLGAGDVAGEVVPGGPSRTVLAVDQPESANWISFPEGAQPIAMGTYVGPREGATTPRGTENERG